jgi:hypothetical protein
LLVSDYHPTVAAAVRCLSTVPDTVDLSSTERDAIGDALVAEADAANQRAAIDIRVATDGVAATLHTV